MEFSIATLLAQFTDDKSIAPKVLEKKLGVQEEELQKLQIALDALEKIGILVKDKGRYRRVSCEDTVEAKLRCSSKGFCFAIQDGEEAEDIYIRESHLSTAWNGDRVLVKVLKEGSRRRSPEGSVKLILERVNPSVLARVKPTPQGFRAVPLDDRLLFELELQSNGTDLAQAIDYLVHVEVLRYPLGSTPPLGRVARILGSDAEAAQDTDIVCCKHDLRRDFPPTVLQAADELSTKLGKAKLKDRLDLRTMLTLSFAPTIGDIPPTYPIQNAFSLERTDAGWKLGIHTVDVASAILTDSLLDREARRRGTTVYLGDTILPLFPETVTPKMELTPGEGRLAISVLLTVNDEGQVLQFEIQPTVVQVDYQLQHSSITGSEPIEVASVMESLFEMAATIRRSRLAGGGWELKVDRQQPFQDRERLGAMVISTADERQSLLGELLLLANQAIAFHVKALGIPCLYCVQGPPDAAELQDLLRLANNLGNDLDLKFELEQESTVLSSDYQRFTELFPKSRDPRILNYLLQLTLKPISYSVRPGHHFGLSTEGYTRVTKPMSRYGDLLMQRVLHSLFEDGRSSRKSNSTKEGVNLRHSSSYGDISWNVLPPKLQQELETQLAAVVSQLSDREKTAADAEADLEGLQKAEQMGARTGEVFSGLITGVQSYGFFVEIEDLLVEGLVHVSSLKDDWYEFRSRHCCLVGRKNRTAYRLGDKVEVRVKSVDYYRQQIDLVTESRGSDASDEDLADE